MFAKTLKPTGFSDRLKPFHGCHSLPPSIKPMKISSSSYFLRPEFRHDDFLVGEYHAKQLRFGRLLVDYSHQHLGPAVVDVYIYA